MNYKDIEDKKFFNMKLLTLRGETILGWVEEKFLMEIRKNVGKNHVVHGEDFSVCCEQIILVQFSRECD